MQLSDILNQTGGLQSIARELGIGEDEAASAASALAPAVLGGFRKQAELQPQGMAGLGGLLNQFGGGGLLDAVLAPQRTDTTPGNDVLGQIFGSKEVSRAVAQNAAAQTGQDPSILKKMLPLLAMVAAGYMAKQHSAAAPASGGTGGGLGGLLGGMFGGRQPADSSADDFGGLLTGAQRNPLDEIIGRLGR
jgi:hypothetical protein